MDLLKVSEVDLYFDESMPDEVSGLLAQASAAYAEGNAESYLMRAFLLAPKNLAVVVALYRFYYYQHRIEDALVTAQHALTISGERIGLSGNWKQLDKSQIGYAAFNSIGLLRFYLMALKGAGYLNLRLGNLDEGRKMLLKVREADPLDQLSASALLDVIDQY